MRIGFFFNDKGFSNLDLRSPVNGNNGVGGTQYCFLMLADALVNYSDHEVVYYHYNENTLPEGVNSKTIIEREDIIEQASKDGIDILIFKAEGATDFVKQLNQASVNAIAWAHNYLLSEELTEYCRNQAIKRVIFVGHEMYDRYIDHPVIKKASYIYNMFDGRVFSLRKLPDIPTVTYTGSLVPAKGFHLLAKVWKNVVKALPTAQLYIIGDGKLYDRDAELGAFGIAQKAYEDQFMPYLTASGNIMDSVHFLGTLGKEKLKIYNNTTVGVMNPTGRTETFGLSAVEMSACGIPVVTKKANGLFDTVVDGKTGYLIRNERELTDRIVRLLKDGELNLNMGEAGKKFADTAFLPENIVKNWDAVFEDVFAGRDCTEIEPTRHYTNNVKWLRILNRKLQRTGIKTKPIVDLECLARNLIRR